VKPFVKSNINTDEQLDLQALHRVRDRLVQRRTGLIKQIRGFLLERGITFAKSRTKLRDHMPAIHMPAILGDAEQNLAPRLRNRDIAVTQASIPTWVALQSQDAPM
jgi:transposase